MSWGGTLCNWCFHFCKRKIALTLKRTNISRYFTKKEEKTFQLIWNKLTHRYFGVSWLCCVNNYKQKYSYFTLRERGGEKKNFGLIWNKRTHWFIVPRLHWFHAHSNLLLGHCLVSSRNALSTQLARDRVAWRDLDIGMQCVKELFLLDGWVEVGQFVLLMFSICKEKEHKFQTNQNIALLYLHLRKKITQKCSIL